MSVFGIALGAAAPGRRPRAARLDARAARRASAPPASPAGMKPSGKPDVGLLVCDGPSSRQRGALHRRAPRPPRRCWSPTSAADCRRCGRCSPTRGCANAATGAAGPRRRRQDAGRRRARLGRRPEPRSRSPRPARSATALPVDAVLKGILAGPLASCAATATCDFQRAIQTTDRTREARRPRGRAAVGERCGCAPQCKGAGMISPRFATMLCFVQTDAAARRRDRRPAARRVRASARSTASRSTASCRPTTPRS